MAIFIMLNNYFHDLAVAVLFSNILLTWFYIKVFAKNSSEENIKQFVRFSTKLTFISLIFILMLGVPRAIFYKEYEWLPAAGRGQVTALIVKHIILASITLFALFLQVNIKRKYF